MKEILSALGWPHFAFAFAVLFLVTFRSQVRSLLGRVTSIDRTGIRAEPNPEAQREDRRKLEAAQELMMAIGSTVVLEEVEGRIRDELTSKHLGVGDETAKVLIKHLAAAQVALAFEQIQNLIFGSQIYLLKRLNEVTGQGQSRDAIEEHFRSAQTMFSDSLGDWSLDDYLHFLFARSLIAFQDGRYHISHLGKEYLVWLARTGRSESRPL